MFLNVNGVRLNVISFGSGPRTLVATGGWTGSWELWQQPFELLTAAGWRCISYDHRGSGESPVDPELITPDTLVEDVVGILDALGVERCLLAGESMGGAVALRAAARHPGRFTGLVLVDAAEGHATSRRSALADGARMDYPATIRQFIDRCVPEPDSEHVRRWGRNILLRAEPEQAARLLEMWSEVTPIDVSTIDLPTLIIHGAEDAIIPLEQAESLAQRMPHAELLVVDGVGHVPTMTRPHAVADAIRQRFPGG